MKEEGNDVGITQVVSREALHEGSLNEVFIFSCSVVPRRYAGHAHWQNVRHIKAANDLHKAQTRSKYVRVIESAVITGGSPDPRFNNLLASAIEQAKKTQVSSHDFAFLLSLLLGFSSQNSCH